MAFAAPGYCPEIEPIELELPMTIGIKFAPPFVMGSKNNPKGLSIELWQLIASCLDLDDNDYTFVEYGSAESLIEAAQIREVDLSIAAISVTAEREQKVDFSHSYFEASLGTLVANRDGTANFALLVGKILQSNLLNIGLGLLFFMFTVALYYWYTERKWGNPFFSNGPLKGFYQALIWATLLVFQGRGDPFSLNTRVGQLFVLFLVFFGVTIISGFTAVITSSLTLQGLEPEITQVSDLKNNVVAVKVQSVAQTWADENNVFVRPMQTFPQVQRKFNEGEIDVFIHDKQILQYLVNEKSLVDVKLGPLSLLPQDYAIALPEQSPLMEGINRSILKILESTIWSAYLREYLGEN